ncbi:TetR/AcrR family transcriptional regulator [Nocardia sp. NPDC020380]|uniref:TetR/AcrR family transcriptional regulator n=1 Tax=Nocardia sp. NPDC020380 TaxID=3364309 RepID=UPI003794FCA3
MTDSPVRRRGAELEESLLDAAWAELREVGYQRLTMEGVAARANTGKQVLYRRWPNRAALVIAAVRRRVGSVETAIPDTGDLRTDVIMLLRRSFAVQREVGRDTVRGLLAEITDLGPDQFEIMGRALESMLRKAADRGEVDMSRLTPRLIRLPADLMRHEMLIDDEVSESVLTEIVDDIYLPLVRGVSARPE